MADSGALDCEARMKKFIQDIVEVCKKHRVTLEVNDGYDFETFQFHEHSENTDGYSFIVDMNEMEDDIRLAVWDTIHSPKSTTKVDLTHYIGRGTPIDLNDKYGRPVHVGDTLMFDESEWGGKFEPYVVTIQKGMIQLYGGPSDVPQFCEIVKRWNEDDVN